MFSCVEISPICWHIIMFGARLINYNIWAVISLYTHTRIHTHTSIYIYIGMYTMLVLLILYTVTLIRRTAKLCLFTRFIFCLAGMGKLLLPVLNRHLFFL